MSVTTKSWKNLFLFCLGLALGAAFCMKWMESDFWAGNEKFTIIGLELSYSKEKLILILASLDHRVETILRYHLIFDFAFMAGVYPGISALCIMARHKIASKGLRRLLQWLAVLQLLAWVGDIIENYYLLKWLNEPVIGNEFGFYHFCVYMKWSIALIGALIAIPIAVRKNRKSRIEIR